ncbi:SIMPL domain-containing protein [Microbacterium sp.]|uniref:SIMPL domain-containing protein n=1 Tax=Microbacterium sp. TaxID=51671 RepID=UPI003A905A3B
MPEVTITVRGEHEVVRAPEEGVAHVTVSREGPERGPVVEAIAALSAPIRDDLAARKDAGGPVEWTSGRAAVWAERPWNAEGKRLAVVHHATVELTATFTDFPALSRWLSEVAERDGVQIGGVRWQLTRATAAALEREVATAAVQVAVARATAYAQALGLTEVTPTEISDLGLLGHDAQPQLMRMAKASFDSAAAGPAFDLQPDDITVSAAVEARFTAR